jgi:hypothetical protein
MKNYKSLVKKWSQGYSNPGPEGKAWHESLKSELATAGAAIHPCIEINQCYNIINGYLNFQKNARNLFFISNPSINPQILVS